MNSTEDTLYPIGDVAHRTRLAVSAIRFYSDEGIVPATEVTAAGHRLYGVEAIARLEFIRTLRDLGTGLDQVRRLLDGETNLHYLLAEHLETVEQQATELRVRRAVLRALVSEDDSQHRIASLHQLVTMPDASRQQLLDDFWREVGAGLSAEEVERLRGAAPHLPDDPTAEQLEAWITLAELLLDPEFRADTQAYLHETYATGPGPAMAAPAVQDFISSAAAGLMPKLMAAHVSGLAPDDPHTRSLVLQYVDEIVAATGAPADDALWDSMGRGFRMVSQVTEAALQHPEYLASYGRYQSLAATISGAPHPDAELDAASLGEFGEWFATSIQAARPTP
jgi:DNA-binding transcriptional MerR regulator